MHNTCNHDPTQVYVPFNFTQNLTAVLQYDRSRVKFSGDKEHINTTSVGLKYRY